LSRSGYVNSEQKRGRLFALVGLPAAGKSTYANDWARFRDEPTRLKAERWLEGDFEGWEPRPRVVLAGDDMRQAVHGPHEYVARAEHLIFSLIDTAAAALLLRGHDVLVDETSTSRPTLRRYLRLDKSVELIFVDTPAEECKRRALAANRPRLLRVIDRLAPRLERLKADWPAMRDELLKDVEHLVLED
jgi:predicted kinase